MEIGTRPNDIKPYSILWRNVKQNEIWQVIYNFSKENDAKLKIDADFHKKLFYELYSYETNYNNNISLYKDFIVSVSEDIELKLTLVDAKNMKYYVRLTNLKGVLNEI